MAVQIEDRSIEGRVNEVIGVLQQSLNGFLRHNARAKIGVTSDPEVRCRRQHDNDGWSRMVLLYRTDFRGSAGSMEKKLIAYAHRANFRVEVVNQRPGGEGLTQEFRQYWVYLLLA